MNEEILEVANKFKKWKRLTKGRGTIIPDVYINEFKQLYSKYNQYDLYKEIGISKYSWDKKVLEKTPPNPKKKRPFVLLADRSTGNDNLTPLMKLKLKNGTEIMVFQ